MKTYLTLIIVLLISTASFAQQGINYKAILKDTNGDLLANTFMNVQFTIHLSKPSAIVYQEAHNYTTDANGLLILNIGTDESPSVGNFKDIDWSADQHFLQTTIAYSGGTINFDATEFMAVPYAKHADTASSIIKLPEPYILGRSIQTSNAKFSFNGKYGWQAAQEMCKASYPNDPNVRAFTLDQIAQAIVLGNWNTTNLNNIENFWFWAITPYAVGSSHGSYQSEEQNGYGLNYIPGDLGNGTRGQILINDTNNIGNPSDSNPEKTYLRVHTNAALTYVYPCICGTYQ